MSTPDGTTAFEAALARADPAHRERALARATEIREAKSTFFRDALVALDFNGISGDYAEFGSYGGLTMRLAHEHLTWSRTPRHLWAFDSFEGLPATTDDRYEHPAWNASSMAMDVETFRATLRQADIPDDAYTTVVGFFTDTLPPLGVDSPPADIALAYIDCDMYTSTETVLDFLAPRLKHGMIIAFDDYHCWSPTALSGERAALLDFEAAHPEWHFDRFRDIGWGGRSFVLEDASLLP